MLTESELILQLQGIHAERARAKEEKEKIAALVEQNKAEMSQIDGAEKMVRHLIKLAHEAKEAKAKVDAEALMEKRNEATVLSNGTGE